MDRVEKHIFTTIAKKYDVPISVVEDIYCSQFEFIRATIKTLDFNSINTEEEFNEMKHTFNIPRLFKMYPSWNIINGIKNNINNKLDEDGEDFD